MAGRFLSLPFGANDFIKFPTSAVSAQPALQNYDRVLVLCWMASCFRSYGSFQLLETR